MRSPIIFRIAFNALVFLLFAYLFRQGLHVSTWQSATIAAIVLALLNQFVKPIIQLISLPITILTLGLFSIVINGLVLSIVDYMVDGFSLSSFGWNIALAILLSISNAWLQSTSKTRVY